VPAGVRFDVPCRNAGFHMTWTSADPWPEVDVARAGRAEAIAAGDLMVSDLWSPRDAVEARLPGGDRLR